MESGCTLKSPVLSLRVAGFSFFNGTQNNGGSYNSRHLKFGEMYRKGGSDKTRVMRENLEEYGSKDSEERAGSGGSCIDPHR